MKHLLVGSLFLFILSLSLSYAADSKKHFVFSQTP